VFLLRPLRRCVPKIPFRANGRSNRRCSDTVANQFSEMYPAWILGVLCIASRLSVGAVSLKRNFEIQSLAHTVLPSIVDRHFRGALQAAFPQPNPSKLYHRSSTIKCEIDLTLYLLSGHVRKYGNIDLNDQKQYLPAGYTYISYSNDAFDSACQKSSVEVGIPANTCMSTGNYGFKIQLVKGERFTRHAACVILDLTAFAIFCNRLSTDSCDDAEVEYFSDRNCTTSVQKGSMDLGDFGGCNAFTGDTTTDLGDGTTVSVPLYFWKVRCTAQPTKPVSVPSASLE
jgi:hypothetical protein